MAMKITSPLASGPCHTISGSKKVAIFLRQPLTLEELRNEIMKENADSQQPPKFEGINLKIWKRSKDHWQNLANSEAITDSRRKELAERAKNCAEIVEILENYIP